jgi:hypothetical protein
MKNKVQSTGTCFIQKIYAPFLGGPVGMFKCGSRKKKYLGSVTIYLGQSERIRIRNAYEKSSANRKYLSRFPCYIKSKFDWWKVLFFHSIDIMIVNAFIIFQEFKKENPLKFDNLPVYFGQLFWYKLH